jgi:hypothetical protein
MRMIVNTVLIVDLRSIALHCIYLLSMNYEFYHIICICLLLDLLPCTLTTSTPAIYPVANYEDTRSKKHQAFMTASKRSRTSSAEPRFLCPGS